MKRGTYLELTLMTKNSPSKGLLSDLACTVTPLLQILAIYLLSFGLRLAV